MNTTCRYHPTRTAHFACPHCLTNFCGDCISRRETSHYGARQNHYFCPKCNVEATSLGIGNIVTPFWKYLPRFFLYPLKIQPLLFILSVTAISYLLGNLPFVNLILWVAVIKYGLLCLNNTAQGDLAPPAITLDVLNEDIGQVFKQFGILIVISFLAGLVFARFGLLAGSFFWLVSILCVPAMIMTLVATDSMVHALNPVVLAKVVFRIGGGYFLMYFFLLLLMGAPAVLAGRLGFFLPPALQYLVYSAATMYYTIMAYALMGYVLLQYADEIGYEVDYENFSEKAGASGSRDNPYAYLINEVNILVQDGKIDEAVTRVKNEASFPVTDFELADKYYAMLKMKKRKKEMLDHGASYLKLLVEDSRREKACEVYRDLIDIDKDFTPPAEFLSILGKWLMLSGNPGEAARALIQFTRAYPDHADLPEVYFNLARFLHSRQNNEEKSREILQYILRKYPAHEVAGLARNYLEQMA